jgi:hypothetical protein
VASGLSIAGGQFTGGDSAITVSGPFSLSGGTFIASAATTTFSSNFTKTTGTYNPNGGVTNFRVVAGNPLISPGNISFNNVAVTSVAANQSGYVLNENMTISGDLTIYGTASYGSYLYSQSNINPVISIAGNLVFPSSVYGVILGTNVAGGNLTVNLAGNMNISSANTNLYAPITFSGTSDQSITKVAGGVISALSAWTINKNSGAVILQNNITHPSTIRVVEGIIDANGKTLTTTGAFPIEDGGTFRLQGGETVTTPTLGMGSTTVVYNGSGSYSSLAAGNNYQNLTFNGSGSWTLNANANATGTLSIISGTLLGNAKTINLNGDWTNSGTFTAGGSTVTLSGADQHIGGSASTTFYNLSKATSTADTLTFSSSVTTVITNNTTLKGVAGQLLSLRSDITGSQSRINVSNSGTRDIQYVDVKDSNNVNAVAILCTVNCHNSLNNTNWIFSMTMTTDLADPVGTSTATLNATIVDNGGSNATQHGFAIGTSSDLSFVMSTTTGGAFSGNGSFSQNLSNLSCNTAYYFRAYTVNSAGTSTGSIQTFTTAICPATLVTDVVTSVGTSTAILNATLSNTGGANATEHGFAYGTSTAFISGISTTTLGSLSGAGTFSENIANISCGTTYYSRAYSVNSAGLSMGSVQTFTTQICRPSVTTTVSANVSKASASIGGTVESDGGAVGLEHGFAFGTSTLLTESVSTSTLGAFSGSGSFAEDLSSLVCETPYYFRAYAVNSVGTSTGLIKTFTTASCTDTTPTNPVNPGSGSSGGGFAPGYGGTVPPGNGLASSPGQTNNKGKNPKNPDKSNSGKKSAATTTAATTTPPSTGTDPVVLPNTLKVIPYSPTSTPVTETIGNIIGEVVETAGDIVSLVADSVINPVVRFFAGIFSGSSNNLASKTDNSKPIAEPIVDSEHNIRDTSSSDIADVKNSSGSVVGAIFSNLGGLAATIAEPLERSEVAKTAAEIVIAGGAVAGVMVGSFGLSSRSLSFSDIILIVTRLWGLLLTFLGLKKRSPHWGVVYDSETMRPLDPAIVTVRNQSGKEVASAVTDMDGRYGFLLSPGTYTIRAGKTHYMFPSKMLRGQTADDLHDSLYFGEPFTIADSAAVIKKDIPMDPVGFDWNEFIKNEMHLNTFYSRFGKKARIVSKTAFLIGLVLSGLYCVYNPVTSNSVILLIYLLSAFFVFSNRSPRSFGNITDHVTGKPLSFARIHILSTYEDTEIGNKSCDELGRYFCLVPKGSYYIRVDRRNPDGSYTDVYKSDLIRAKGGIIRNDIEV